MGARFWIMVGALAVGSSRSAAAQVLGLPVVNHGAPVGIAVGVDYGMSNHDAGKGWAVGGTAALGVGIVGVSASISRFAPDGGGDVYVSPGATASLSLFGGPLIPFRAVLQAGYASWGETQPVTLADEVPEVDVAALVPTKHYTASVGLAATIPVPGFAVKPWIAPRIDMIRQSGVTTTDFAVSGGIDVSLLSGLSLRAAYDRISRAGRTPGVFSIGVGYSP